MAIPASGSLAMSTIRSELQNTGTSSFRLAFAGQQSGATIGSGYVPLNQSSSSKPNDNSPYSISEWYSYNHSQNTGCGVTFYSGLTQIDKYFYQRFLITGCGVGCNSPIRIFYSNPPPNNLSPRVDYLEIFNTYPFNNTGTLTATSVYSLGLGFGSSLGPYEYEYTVTSASDTLYVVTYADDPFDQYDSGPYSLRVGCGTPTNTPTLTKTPAVTTTPTNTPTVTLTPSITSSPLPVSGLDWTTTLNNPCSATTTTYGPAGWVISNNNQTIRYNIVNSQNCGGTCSSIQSGTAQATITVGGSNTWMYVDFAGIGELEDPDFELLSITLDGVLVADAHAAGGGLGCTMGPVVKTYYVVSPYQLNAGTTHTLDLNFTTADALYHIDCYYQIDLTFSTIPPTPSQTATPPVTPSNTATPTQTPTVTQAALPISLTAGQGDECTACRSTTYIQTKYVSPGNTVPDVNDIVYNVANPLSSVFAGNSLWYGTTWGATGSESYSIQVNNSGVIIAVKSCSTCPSVTPTQTQTATPPATPAVTPTPSSTSSQYTVDLYSRHGAANSPDDINIYWSTNNINYTFAATQGITTTCTQLFPSPAIEVSPGTTVYFQVTDSINNPIFFNGADGTANSCPANSQSTCTYSFVVNSNTSMNITAYVNSMFGTFVSC